MNKTTRYRGNKQINGMAKQIGYIYSKDNNIYIVIQGKHIVKLYGSDYLDQKISTIINKESFKEELYETFGGAFHFKGSKNSLDELNQLTQKNNGDVWQVGQKQYAYNGTEFILLGFNVDLSEYAKISNVYTKTEIDNKGYLTQHQDISGKVDKIDGKQLSTNDYTDEQKAKLSSLSNYDDTTLVSSISTAKEQAISSAKETALQIDGSNSLNKVLVMSEKTTQPLGAKDIQKHKMTIDVNPVGYGVFSFNFTNADNTTFTTKLQIGSSNDSIVVKSEADSTYAAKATTLEGYGITDAKIEEGIITLGANTIKPITAHQDISSKLDLLSTGHADEIITAQDNGTITNSGKKSGIETLGTLITNDQLKNNVINQLGITSDFDIAVGADHSSVMSNEYVYDSIHIASYGDQNGLSLYYDQGEWKKTQVIFFANDLYDTFKYKKGQEELSAQLLVDELPTDGSLKNAGVNFQTNDLIGTTSATIKIKTLSDNVIHEFKVGRQYSSDVLATEKAVKNEISNNVPTKLSQLTNDVPYLTKTCLPFPDDLQQYAYPEEAGTTLAFCQEFDNLGLAIQGRIYLGQIGNLSDMPFPGNAECMISVCEDGVFTLEMFSTTTQCYHWTATYPGTVGSNLVCPWKGNLTCTVSAIADSPVYTPTSDYDATTKKYVDDKIGDINTILDSINGEEL